VSELDDVGPRDRPTSLSPPNLDGFLPNRPIFPVVIGTLLAVFPDWDGPGVDGRDVSTRLECAATFERVVRGVAGMRVPPFAGVAGAMVAKEVRKGDQTSVGNVTAGYCRELLLCGGEDV
jgi:hypothetical protein